MNMVKTMAESMRIGNMGETLVRSELERHGWIVYRGNGQENVHVDMIAAKCVKNQLILRAIQVKSRKGFGTTYPTVQWKIDYGDKRLFYITALTVDEKKWDFYVVPIEEVKTKYLNITKNGKYEKYRNNWEILELLEE